MEHLTPNSGNLAQSVDAFCQYIWDQYEENSSILPCEVTLNTIGTGIFAKVDEDGLFFEANGEEFDLEEFFMENNLQSDTLGIAPHSQAQS
ncbi:hypothetical protein [Tumebacillus lipolyticus]|uniref:Uncharacterized protein n=1 Tax=Tumebacillus lipolyticus TaxID=1280370 RepID=A0ABW5A2H7_9BACL